MNGKILVAALLVLGLALLFRLLRGRRYVRGWTARFIASPEFLRTPEWRRVRYDALRANDGRCELCGRNKHQLPPGEYLEVDHIRSRRARPDLALALTNLAVLCSADNAGKGNRHADDWRHRSHPHRRSLRRPGCCRSGRPGRRRQDRPVSSCRRLSTSSP